MLINKTRVGWAGSILYLALFGISLAAPPRESPAEFNKDMRKLWEDHITWTRLYIVNALNDLPSKDATAERLLRNQADIGKAFQPYYGEAAGKKLTLLLRGHVLIASQVIDAAKRGDSAKQADALKRWYGNSDEIAAFLGKLNPENWPSADMRAMLREHLDTTTEEVKAGLRSEEHTSELQ